ncbi:3-deoxy-manno-octulosonate cytidylyltransferase [bacterium]|nr:3-deoxy-manno-octulosonate cytidylyltransferase [bacterium]
MNKKTKIVGLIPSRLRSTRLPEKPLKLIEGIPMIAHVYQRCLLCPDLDELYVVTDSKQIADVVEKIGGKYIMTNPNHPTGSDRLAEAAARIEADIVVNIQGDEALVKPEHISTAVQSLVTDPFAKCSILVCDCYERNAPNEIKIVLDKMNYVLYFSREDIPSSKRTAEAPLKKIYCIVPFRKNFLLTFASMEQTALEKIEYNEYLRILENGYKIKGVYVEHVPPSVDDADDLELVRMLMKEDLIKEKYLAKTLKRLKKQSTTASSII